MAILIYGMVILLGILAYAYLRKCGEWIELEETIFLADKKQALLRTFQHMGAAKAPMCASIQAVDLVVLFVLSINYTKYSSPLLTSR
jgi:hypothetical protein